MRGMFSNQSLVNGLADVRSQTTSITSTSLISPGPHPTRPPVDVNDVKNPIEKGLDAAAAFFGLSLDHRPTRPENLAKPEGTDGMLPYQNTTEPIRATSSKPIKVSNRSQLNRYQDDIQQESFQEALHRRHSDPLMNTLDSDNMDEDSYYQSNSHTNDFVDPRDGHIWRAKYCVLDGGILYFYRNLTDGESPEAVSERGEDLSSKDSQPKRKSSISDLSKSPMARNFFHHHEANESRDSTVCMWEKRVVLDCVGTVRSAEQEYGPNSFELQGIANDDDSLHLADTLVLRARDHASMNEWIFQFHRSLASLVKDFVEAFGRTGGYIDIDYPLRANETDIMISNYGQDEISSCLLTRSPRLAFSTPPVLSLSHGHGRITGHRRKNSDIKTKLTAELGLSSLSSTPETGVSASFNLSTSKYSSPISHVVYVSPGNPPHDKFLIPPQSHHFEHNEASKDQTRQVPSEKSSRKYVPPNMRGNGEQSNDLTRQRYVPPSLRNRPCDLNDRSLRTLSERETTISPDDDTKPPAGRSEHTSIPDVLDDVLTGSKLPIQRGGCADPNLVSGSILDWEFIPRQASKLYKCRSEAFGSYGGQEGNISWETGAVSECGVRESNEDAYLIAHDLTEALLSLTESNDNGCKKRASSSLTQSLMGIW